MPDTSTGAVTGPGGATTFDDPGTSTTGTTAPGVDTTADTGPPADTETASGPSLTISHGPTHDFGTRQIGAAVTNRFTLTNVGDTEATGVVIGLVEPGIDDSSLEIIANDCGDTLAANADCEIEVDFAPRLFGPHAGSLEVEFVDHRGETESVARALVGVGVGATDNLLVNGDGEVGGPDMSPPQGWTAGAGDWNYFGTDAGLGGFGDYTIYPGEQVGGLSQYTLSQQLQVDGLTTWGDAAGLTFHYRIQLRTFDIGDDPASIILRFGDDGSNTIEEFPSAAFSGGWQQGTAEHIAPANTHDVQLVLGCLYMQGSLCSAWFDDMELWAEWDG